jgi:8-oxo-dGTP pyrophosphatase MutT (NUDIX family)
MSDKTEKKLKPWQRIKSENGPELMLFHARYEWLKNPRNKKVFKRIVLETSNWVNIVAITPQKQVVLVRQYRFGSGNITTEIPAGLMDKNESSQESAIRELMEETGYCATKWTYLGFVEPNPAFLNNRCHHWLAEEVIKENEPQPDEGEDIRIVLYSFDELAEAIRQGEVNHVLALSALSRIPDFWNRMQMKDFTGI